MEHGVVGTSLNGRSDESNESCYCKYLHISIAVTTSMHSCWFFLTGFNNLSQKSDNEEDVILLVLHLRLTSSNFILFLYTLDVLSVFDLEKSVTLNKRMHVMYVENCGLLRLFTSSSIWHDTESDGSVMSWKSGAIRKTYGKT